MLIFLILVYFKVLNLENVGTWFDEEITESDGFKPRSMLTIPIYNGQR